jgi:dihydropteroate synthase
MALENRVRVLGLHDVEITRQALKMLAKLLVGDDTLQVSILTLIGVPLAG